MPSQGVLRERERGEEMIFVRRVSKGFRQEKIQSADLGSTLAPTYSTLYSTHVITVPRRTTGLCYCYGRMRLRKYSGRVPDPSRLYCALLPVPRLRVARQG